MTDSSSYTSLASVETLNGALVGYTVKRQIGHGAMGVVFEAEQQRLRRRVAIKVLPTSMALRTRTVKRFLREASAMGRLSHENIVAVYEVGSIDNLHFFSMKYVEGPPLDRVLKAGPLAIKDVVQIGIDVAKALAHAHSHGVMHRDIKPGNLLRDVDRVVLTDFGLARPLDSEETGTMTESGDLVGTPLYMAPEQITADSARIDGRSDLWALGVTLYELLTQRAPFPGANAQSILNAILHKDPALLHKLRDDVPRDLEAVILKCLEKDLGRRYSGAAALLADLQAVQEGRPVTANAPRFFDPPLRWIRRHPFEAGVVGSALVVALFLGLAVQQRSIKLESTEKQLDQVTAAKQEAEDVRDTAVGARTEARVLYELSSARIAWARGIETGDDQLRDESAQQVYDLVGTLMVDPDQNMDQIAECVQVLARMFAEEDEAEVFVQTLSPQLEQLTPDVKQAVRAAYLTGFGDYDQALALHNERSRRDLGDARPVLAAAKLTRERASTGQSMRPFERVGYLVQALAMNERAAELAIRAKDAELLTTILIETARCRIDLARSGSETDGRDDLDVAVEILERALVQESERVEAQALLLTARRKQKESTPAPSKPPPPPTFLAEIEDTTGFDIEGLMQATPTLAREDLESAGRGLSSILGGLRTLLQSAGTADE